MGVPSRPKLLEEQIRRYVRITDAGDWTSEEYRELHDLLSKTLGESDPILVNASVKRNFQQLTK